MSDRGLRPGFALAAVGIGLLQYVADIPNGPIGTAPGASPSRGPGQCASASYSSTDPNLVATPPLLGLTDQQSDQISNPANTLSVTLNLTGCLGSTAWASGETVQVDITGISQYGDNSPQTISFRRQ